MLVFSLGFINICPAPGWHCLSGGIQHLLSECKYTHSTVGVTWSLYVKPGLMLFMRSLLMPPTLSHSAHSARVINKNIRTEIFMRSCEKICELILTPRPCPPHLSAGLSQQDPGSQGSNVTSNGFLWSEIVKTVFQTSPRHS